MAFGTAVKRLVSPVLSLASAASSATIAWALTALAFGLACKEIKLGGMRGRRLKILEAFIIISTVFQLIYVGLLHAGIYSRRYGPGYYDYGDAEYGGAGHEPQKTTAPPPAV